MDFKTVRLFTEFKDNLDLFFVIVFPDALNALSLGALDAGTDSIPIATLLKVGNLVTTGECNQKFN